MWIARDKNNELYLFKGKPRKRSVSWLSNEPCTFLKDKYFLFKDIKWEDDEPTELILKK